MALTLSSWSRPPAYYAKTDKSYIIYLTRDKIGQTKGPLSPPRESWFRRVVQAKPAPSRTRQDRVRSIFTETKSRLAPARSNFDPLYDLDPEIEITLHRLRKVRNTVVNNSSSFDSVSNSNNSISTTNDSDPFEYSSAKISSFDLNKSQGLEQMENSDRTLKELATPNTYELKSCLIDLLPKFHGLAGKDPHKHLKELHVVYSTVRSKGISEDYIKMKAWSCYGLAVFAAGSLQHLGRYETHVPGEVLSSIKDYDHLERNLETLHEYWERFNKLCATCPHHQISELLLIQYFYEGLTMMERSMIDAASGGALMDKTPTTTRHLISKMTSNTQQFRIRGASPSRMVNEIDAVDNLRLENQLTELTSLVRKLAVGQHQPSIAVRVCGICTSVEHPTDMCPTLQETESGHLQSVGAIGGYQYADISARAESRAICGSAIWICPECTLMSNRLSTAESVIPRTTFPTIAAIESANSMQLAIFGGPDEAVSHKKSGVPAKYELQ
ncbi:hypothetical protein CR513_28445, partial [Mucuna pruriens]